MVKCGATKPQYVNRHVTRGNYPVAKPQREREMDTTRKDTSTMPKYAKGECIHINVHISLERGGFSSKLLVSRPYCRLFYAR